MTKGIRISQAGISVDRAADYQKTMDERWPVFEHIFMGILNIEQISTASFGVLENALGTIADIPIFKHGLGYLPAFRVSPIAIFGFSTSNNLLQDIMFADEQNIYLRISKTAGPLVIGLKIFLAVVDRDCSKEFQYPIDIVTSSQSTNPSQYGLKILNNPTTRGMGEKNKSLYSFNTNAKSMLIQQHGIRTAVSPDFRLDIDHRLGYPPTYYLARRLLQVGSANPSLGKLTMQPMSAGKSIAKSNSITLSIRGGQSNLEGDYMFIILKDPVDVAR